ncbi:MAG: M13 family peptidase [Cyanobacteria bacterium PR.023]|nr:M13 family peptidase [Cyanobacteria bacterium PR.023]MDQ5936927.1 family metallopeptidase [Cyanobacteriota bacterium erpe_2018_sw_21hr_WHONDRS-SW48-000092_B_bin.40]
MTKNHGIKPAYMDRSVSPGVDFNRFANGTWIDTTEIPAKYPRWGAFLMLRDQTLEQTRVILEELATRSETFAPGSIEQKVNDFFASGMDEAAIEAAGINPIKDELARINTIRSLRRLGDVIAHLHTVGVGGAFAFGASPDADDSSQMIGHALQSGIGLPDRDYYLGRDKKSKELRQQYVNMLCRMFELIGEKPTVARRHAEAVLKLETAMAKAFMSKEDRRDPDKTKNKMTIAQFQALVPKLNVTRYFSNIGCPPMETLNVMQPAYFQALNKLLTKVSLNDWRVYLRWQLIRSSSSALPAAFGDASFEFYGKTMQGSKEREPRWMRMISATNSALGEALGQLYVAKHFKPEAKAKMLELIALLQDAFRESINERTWMSEETRTNALAKLDAFVPMIGYPDKWRDYSELHIDRTSFAANCLRSDEFEHKADLAKIGKPVDQSEWHMTPQTVNAYYSPQSNRIVFPAAILQDPFFDPEADFAFNCGGILVVIGHEESHGFDDKGCRYDGQGNLRNWFAEGDLDKFMVLINLLKKQFGQFTVAGGKKVNPNLVAGEAAGDLGGIKLALRVLKKHIAKNGMTIDENGYNDLQRFFIAFGQIWASKVTPQYEEQQVATDPHPPAQFRVNGTLAHLAEFAEAFGLPDDCPMMLPPADRCDLW